MTQHNTLYVKLANSQINKFKPAIKNGTKDLRLIFNQIMSEILTMKIIFHTNHY